MVDPGVNFLPFGSKSQGVLLNWKSNRVSLHGLYFQNCEFNNFGGSSVIHLMCISSTER